MKHTTLHRSRPGFTLIEMLVVIAIIAILAGILLPVVGGMQRKGRIAQANVEMKNLASAITAYQSLYGIYPCSDTDAKAAADKTYDQGNNEIMVILLDISTNAVPVNLDHKRNPQKHVFFNGKMATTVAQPGIGPDFHYRDPWGTPYVITLDLNYDSACEDKVYGRVPAPVMIWSCGPNRKPLGQSGNPTAKDNDDIKSW